MNRAELNMYLGALVSFGFQLFLGGYTGQNSRLLVATGHIKGEFSVGIVQD